MQEKVAKGKVIHKEGKYFLDVAGKMEAIPVGLLADEGVLKKMVGQEVEVFYSVPQAKVVAIKDILKHVPIICNIPRVDFIGTVVTNPSTAMMRNVAAKLLKNGVITQVVHDKMLEGIG